MSTTAKKSRMISMRITEEQFAYLADFQTRIREQSGFRITRASIILKLMEYGKPQLEQSFPRNNDPGQPVRKRFVI